MTKYQDWYNRIVDRGKSRTIPACYTEIHHIKPRAFGGGDEQSNLVRLTYREHFLVHWLLTKICSGEHLRLMRRALDAMVLPIGGQRIVAGWQVEAAKRAIRDLADSDEVQAANRRKYLERRDLTRRQAHQREIARRENKRDLRAKAPELAKQAKTKSDLANLATMLLKRGKPPKDFISPNAPPEAKRRHALKAEKIAMEVFPDAF